MWADGNAVGDRRTLELSHRPGLKASADQTAVLRVALQQPLPLKMPADTPR